MVLTKAAKRVVLVYTALSVFASSLFSFHPIRRHLVCILCFATSMIHLGLLSWNSVQPTSVTNEPFDFPTFILASLTSSTPNNNNNSFSQSGLAFYPDGESKSPLMNIVPRATIAYL